MAEPVSPQVREPSHRWAARTQAVRAVLGNEFVVVAALLLWVLYAWRLGLAPLFDIDEGAFSEASREMLSSGDWGHTTLNGEDRFDKPILVYWLQAGLMGLAGVDTWVARLPSVACAVATAVATGLWAQQVWGKTHRWPATWIVGCSLGMLAIGRSATADALLNLLLTLAGQQIWLCLNRGNVVHLRWAALWMGLGLLAKGPVAVLVPGAALALWSLSTDRGAWLWRALKDGASWLVVVAVAAPWYGYALWRHGDLFVNGFLFKHNFSRYTGVLEGHGGSLFYYLLVLPLLWLPWSGLLAAVAVHASLFWRNTAARFLCVWVAFVLVFFSLSGTKLPHYALYCAAPLGMLMAHAWLERAHTLGWQRVLWVTLFAQQLLMLALPLLATHFARGMPDLWLRHLFLTAPDLGPLAWAVVGSICLSVVALLPVWGSWRLRFGVGTFATALLFVGAVVPWWGQTLQGPVQSAGRWARQQAQPLVQTNVHLPSFSFYHQTPTPKRAPQTGEWALVRLDRLPHPPAAAHVYFQERGLAVVDSAAITPSPGSAP